MTKNTQIINLDICFECGIDEDISMHHIVPRSRGGTKCIPLCHQCHRNAHGGDGKGLNHSRLIREGMAAAAARGSNIGNPDMHKMRRASAIKRRENADKFSLSAGRLIDAYADLGLTQKQTAEMLNDSGVKSPRGKSWTQQNVSNVHKRFKSLID